MRRTIVALAAGLVLGLGGTALTNNPAQAAVPDAWGFAFMHNSAPPPGTILDVTRQWGSWKTAFPADWATVTQIGVGRYRVTFPHIASTRGVVHVTAVSGDARWCQVMTWFASGVNELVDVQCYRNGGVPAPARFSIVYGTSSGAPTSSGAFGYVFANLLGGTINSYNSAGLVNTVSKFGPGQYKVTLPGLAGAAVGLAGDVQVTSVHPNSPRRCKVANFARVGAGYSIIVYCHDQANVLTDSWFDLTFQDKRAIFGGLAPPKNIAYLWTGGGGATNYNSQGGANTVISSGVGQYLVQFGLVGVAQTDVQVTAYGPSPDYCILQEVWGFSGTTVVVRNVFCFNGAGVPTPNQFFVTYTSRV